MGCGRCLASNLLVLHLDEDDSQADLSTHELARTRLVPQLNIKVLGS